ncbi:class I SAM-dependent DNA methyltransferase [Aquibacillus sediminis]|uniref:class I SAM-dependent DNA methyltransferase n=1 Tax=Aquibacillus sediminis TaxID=2574734 RepID=UPI001108CEE8|nr:class I SAM-dependent methyltransferase [Aquibacillus sediminis]
MSYAKMAQVYDSLMEDAPYDEWTEFAIHMFTKYGNGDVRNVIDLGCGTGQITTRLAQEGYDMSGVDLSADMLTYAQHHALEQQVSIKWFQQDLRQLQGFHGFDAVISFCDVINYITNEEDVKQVFKHVNSMLEMNGLFLFDVHSMAHVENDLKDQTFAEVYDDLSYIWLCQPGEHEGEVHHDLTFFVLDESQYDRFDENHQQRTYPVHVYNQWLIDNGFEAKGVFADFSVDQVQSDGERLFFVYEKIRESE